MVISASWVEEQRTVSGTTVQVFSGGAGAPLLVLHDQEYPVGWHPYLAELAASFSVVAPSHPGFGSSDLPPEFDSVDDLAYFYLDFLEARGNDPVNLIGLGLGGWIAAEIAVRCTHQLRRLVLVDSVGIKVSDRTTTDIVDNFVLNPREFLEHSWHDAEAGAEQMKLPRLHEYSEEELTHLLRNRESAALFGWKPFMHNPKLKARLARIDVPALVLWGQSDRIVNTDYGRAFAAAIPGAKFDVIAAAGHYPYLERPQEFAQRVTAFLRGEGSQTGHQPADDPQRRV